METMAGALGNESRACAGKPTSCTRRCAEHKEHPKHNRCHSYLNNSSTIDFNPPSWCFPKLCLQGKLTGSFTYKAIS